MSIAAVVTRGYGSFGSVALVATAGYTSGTVVVVTPPTLRARGRSDRLVTVRGRSDREVRVRGRQP